MLINGNCGAGYDSPTSTSSFSAPGSASPLNPAAAAEVFSMNRNVRLAQQAANTAMVRSPLDWQDMGLQIMKDVQNTNQRGAGGPQGILGPASFVTKLAGQTTDSQQLCDLDTAPAVEVVPLWSSVAKQRPLRLSTTQGTDVPIIPASASRGRGLGDAYPVGGAYPISCSLPTNPNRAQSSDASWSGWGWLLLIAGLGMMAASSGGGSTRKSAGPRRRRT